MVVVLAVDLAVDLTMDGTFFTDEEGNLTTAGYGTIGVGLLGLLYFGTKLKKK